MPLFDFECPSGHVAERLVPAWVSSLKCDCGEFMHRKAVARMNFAMPFKRGERVANYHEAAQEVEYRASLTDNPEALATAAAVRPAFYRAQARVWAEGPNAGWDQATDADKRRHERGEK